MLIAVRNAWKSNFNWVPLHKKVGLPKWQILFGKYLDTSSLDGILAKLNSVHLVLISFPRCLANVPTINFMLPKYSQISLIVRVCSISCFVISHDDPERVAVVENNYLHWEWEIFVNKFSLSLTVRPSMHQLLLFNLTRRPRKSCPAHVFDPVTTITHNVYFSQQLSLKHKLTFDLAHLYLVEDSVITCNAYKKSSRDQGMFFETQ